MLPGVRPIMRLASAPDRDHLAVVGVERDHRRLVQHDAASAHVDQRVGGAEVDRHVAAEERQRVAHREREPSDPGDLKSASLSDMGSRPRREALGQCFINSALFLPDCYASSTVVPANFGECPLRLLHGPGHARRCSGLK